MLLDLRSTHRLVRELWFCRDDVAVKVFRILGNVRYGPLPEWREAQRVYYVAALIPIRSCERYRACDPLADAEDSESVYVKKHSVC